MVRSLLLLLPAVLFLDSAQAQLALEISLVQRSINIPAQRNVVTLSCTQINSVDGSTLPVDQPSFFYRDPTSSIVNPVPELVACSCSASSSITFMITPATEGSYFCRDTMNRESNELQLVAYPTPDESIAEETVYAEQEGEQVTLSCEFKEGKLSHLYTLRWYRSGTDVIINGDENVNHDKYAVIEGTYSLLIKNLDNRDNTTYRCQVVVNNPGTGNPFTESGRVIHLEVYDAVSITEAIESQVVREGERTEPFTCVAQGTPLPTIQWSFGGSVIGDSGIESGLFDITMKKTDDNEITSTLTVREAQTRDNVEIACIATNKPLTQSESFIVSSTVNLTVYPSQITKLVLTYAKLDTPIAFVDFVLPDPIQGEALLWVRYLDESTDGKDVPYPNAIVNNAHSVHFALPYDDWKGFHTFFVQVALTAPSESPSNVFMSSSNRITIVDDDTVLSETTIHIIIGAGSAVLVILLLILVVGLVCCCACWVCSRDEKDSPDNQNEDKREKSKSPSAVADSRVTEERKGEEEVDCPYSLQNKSLPEPISLDPPYELYTIIIHETDMIPETSD